MVSAVKTILNAVRQRKRALLSDLHDFGRRSVMFAGVGIYGRLVALNLSALTWSFLMMLIGPTMLIAGAECNE